MKSYDTENYIIGLFSTVITSYSIHYTKLYDTATTNNGCATTDTFYIPSFPVIPVSGTQYYSTAYSSGSDTTGWIPVQLYKPQQNSTWQYVPITAQYADDKHPVGKYMWITGNTAASVNERRNNFV